MHKTSDLYLRYDRPAARYNTYPIPAHWNNVLDSPAWQQDCRRSLDKPKPRLSIYIHIPFCEKKCSYCACSTYITTNHDLEKSYIQRIHQEFAFYQKKISQLSHGHLVHLYLGGGTPNFLSAQNLERLLEPILSTLSIAKQHEFTVEMDLRHVDYQHFASLYKLGFRHLRLGIEDFSPAVQRIINRRQSKEQASMVCDTARGLGYHSIHFDMIYGLPLQTPANSAESMRMALNLKPEYLSYFSYTHVYGIGVPYRAFTQEELPLGADKWAIYQSACEVLNHFSFQAFGMDHFAQVDTPLLRAKEEHALQRLIMGYSCLETDLLLGLGASAISVSKNGYHQNENILNEYNKEIVSHGFATARSHKLSKGDIRRRFLIQQLTTQGRAELEPEEEQLLRFALRPLEEANCLQYKSGVLEMCRPEGFLLRNVCAAVDAYTHKYE